MENNGQDGFRQVPRCGGPAGGDFVKMGVGARQFRAEEHRPPSPLSAVFGAADHVPCAGAADGLRFGREPAAM
jgi:hypothetical protein